MVLAMALTIFLSMASVLTLILNLAMVWAAALIMCFQMAVKLIWQRLWQCLRQWFCKLLFQCAVDRFKE